MVRMSRARPCQQLEACAAQIRAPVLFIHGQHDRTVPFVHAQRIHKLVEDAGGSSRFELMADAGHLMIRFQAKQLVATIAAFS
jgi:pimeloyl-ACP methyl ester carboxylesterase